MMKRNEQYWTEADRAALLAAETFSDLVPIALAVLRRMPQPIVQVCGPISTGGRGNTRDNLEVFDKTIDRLMKLNHNVFDQVPFEKPVIALKKKATSSNPNRQLLTEFYLPIFNAKLVSTLYFIYDWQSSEGAKWEHEQAERLGMAIVYLEPNFLET